MATADDNTEWYNKIPDGYSESSTMGDRVLLVEGIKFPVNSELLSLHSDYFKALFNGEFKEKSEEEIELKDVKADDLRNFLQLTYPGRFEITKDTYKSLFELSFRFLANYALDSCRLFVEKNFESLDKLDLLEFAFKYNLNYIKEFFRNTFKRAGPAARYACTVHQSAAPYYCCVKSRVTAVPSFRKDTFIIANRDRIAKLPTEIQAFILQAFMYVA